MAIGRNAAANFLAGAIGSLAMLATLPMIVSILGVEDYGLLTLVLAITGYFSIVDVNVTGGSVRYLSEFHSKGDQSSLNQVVTFGLLFYLLLGLGGALAIFAFAPDLIGLFGHIDQESNSKAIYVLQIAAFGFLVGQLHTYANSIPQALQRYDITARLEAFFGTLTPVLTLAILLIGGGLIEVVTARVALSLCHALFLYRQVRVILPALKLALPGRNIRSMLISFSAYSYLSRLSAVTYSQADKLIVGSLLGMAALTYYSVAAQIASRISGFIFRLSSVVFPAASSLHARAEHELLTHLYFASTRYITFLNGAAILVLCLMGRELLHYWMGPEFAEQGYWVLVFIASALFFDSLTTLPSLVNDAIASPKNTGFFAVSRTILSLVIMFSVASQFGIEAVAMAHAAAAATVCGVFLVYIHRVVLPWSLVDVLRDAMARPLFGLAAISVAMFFIKPVEVQSIASAGLELGLLVLCLVVYAWLFVLRRKDYEMFFRPAERLRG